MYGNGVAGVNVMDAPGEDDVTVTVPSTPLLPLLSPQRSPAEANVACTDHVCVCVGAVSVCTAGVGPCVPTLAVLARISRPLYVDDGLRSVHPEAHPDGDSVYARTPMFACTSAARTARGRRARRTASAAARASRASGIG